MAPVKSDLSFDDMLRAGLRVPLRDRKPKDAGSSTDVKEPAPNYKKKRVAKKRRKRIETGV